MINDLFYYTGVTFWTILATLTIGFILFILWNYLSVSIAFWWILIKAESRHGGVVEKDFVKKDFWKIRLLSLILLDREMVTQAMSTTITGKGYRADFTTSIPRIELTSAIEQDD